MLVPVLSEVVVAVAVLVVNRERSFCWNSTLIGWAHMMIGPVTVVVFKSVSSRAGTIVPPLAKG